MVVKMTRRPFVCVLEVRASTAVGLDVGYERIDSWLEQLGGATY